MEAAVNGYTFFLTGQAGTGKSFAVKEIHRKLTSLGRNVVIICSSGITGTVYSELNTFVSTVHSFYGLQTADLPWKSGLDRATSNNLVVERVEKYDCIIWDEASMSSRRIFEIVNLIHLTLASESDHLKPMGGKQVILVGEFLQLQRVPNFFEGKFLFNFFIFQKAFLHRFELTIALRQEGNLETSVLLNSLKEVRLGQCSDETLDFLWN